MKIKEITFRVTQTRSYVIVMNEENGYDMPSSPKQLVDLITEVRNDPCTELEWNTDNLTYDEMVIDDYDIKEVK
jgi:hypothetical protein